MLFGSKLFALVAAFSTIAIASPSPAALPAELSRRNDCPRCEPFDGAKAISSLYLGQGNNKSNQVERLIEQAIALLSGSNPICQACVSCAVGFGLCISFWCVLADHFSFGDRISMSSVKRMATTGRRGMWRSATITSVIRIAITCIRTSIATSSARTCARCGSKGEVGSWLAKTISALSVLKWCLRGKGRILRQQVELLDDFFGPGALDSKVIGNKSEY